MIISLKSIAKVTRLFEWKTLEMSENKYLSKKYLKNKLNKVLVLDYLSSLQIAAFSNVC